MNVMPMVASSWVQELIVLPIYVVLMMN